MKKLLIAIIATTLFSCSKPDITNGSSYGQSLQSGNPTVTNVTWYKAYAGSHLSIGFDVTLNVPDTGRVSQIELFRVPAFPRWIVDNPKSGHYTMYDHIINDWPTYPENALYYFTFKMTDGTTLVGDPFQVY